MPGMDILDLVRADLKGASLERQNEVAAGSGVPWSTLRKIVDRVHENPRYDTVERLRKYYIANPPIPIAEMPAIPAASVGEGAP